MRLVAEESGKEGECRFQHRHSLFLVEVWTPAGGCIKVVKEGQYFEDVKPVENGSDNVVWVEP